MEITNKGQVPCDRIAKVLGCLLGLTSAAKESLSEAETRSRKGKKHLKSVKENLSLMQKGLEHELMIVNVVNEYGFPFVKSFEGHERLNRDARKRIDHVKAIAKSAEKEKEKKKSFPKKAAPKSGMRPQRTGKEKIQCFLCQQFGHVKADCKNKPPHP